MQQAAAITIQVRLICAAVICRVEDCRQNPTRERPMLEPME
jgi:hypothetical protein